MESRTAGSGGMTMTTAWWVLGSAARTEKAQVWLHADERAEVYVCGVE
jgi:hypothetical protein